MRNLRKGFATIMIVANCAAPTLAVAGSDISETAPRAVAQSTQAQGDYIPPPRGTPDGRISGGTRGLSKVTGTVPSTSTRPQGEATIGEPRSLVGKPPSTAQQ